MITNVQIKHSGRENNPEPTEKEVHEADLWYSSWTTFKKIAKLYAIISVNFPFILQIFPNTCNTIMQSSHAYTQQWLSIKGAYPTPQNTQDTNADVYSVHSHKALHFRPCNKENS
jgi:hypothetical protein